MQDALQESQGLLWKTEFQENFICGAVVML